jgi:hypothetical protein
MDEGQDHVNVSRSNVLRPFSPRSPIHFHASSRKTEKTLKVCTFSCGKKRSASLSNRSSRRRGLLNLIFRTARSRGISIGLGMSCY